MISLANRRRIGGAWQSSWAALLLCLVAVLSTGGVSQGETAGLPSDLALLRASLQSDLAKANAEDQVELLVEEGALVIRLAAGLLYESGQVRLRHQAFPVLDIVGRRLRDTEQHLVVEGHTDSDPMLPNPTIPDNWALSGARANGVLRYLLEFHQIDSARLATAGYGESRPVASNQSQEGKARNRRVEIRVLAQGS